jgi:uncharacterized membrane protein YhaH (DUF805 family)
MKKSFIEGFNNYINFAGRAARRNYWMFVLCFLASYFIFQLVGLVLAVILPHSIRFLGLISMFGYLVLAPPMLAFGVRRIHDLDRSGWFILVPYYNLYLFVQPTGKESNKYGNPVESQ